MYQLLIEEEFAGAHRLRNYRGKCEKLHGHNWKVQVTVTGERPGPNGLLMDFHDLRKKLLRVLKKLDHGYLNDIPFFRKHNPSSENIACYIYRELTGVLKPAPVQVDRVTVWENSRQAASYQQ